MATSSNEPRHPRFAADLGKEPADTFARDQFLM